MICAHFPVIDVGNGGTVAPTFSSPASQGQGSATLESGSPKGVGGRLAEQGCRRQAVYLAGRRLNGSSMSTRPNPARTVRRICASGDPDGAPAISQNTPTSTG